MDETNTRLARLIGDADSGLLDDWMRHQLGAAGYRSDIIREADLRAQSSRLLEALAPAVAQGVDVQSAAYAEVRDLLADVSRTRARLGFSTSETATFVLSLKQVLFQSLQKSDIAGEALVSAIWSASVLLDNLALLTVEDYQRSREEMISRQQQELLELSTPVVRLWDNVLALPLIGTLDSARTQVVMENLLQEIVNTGSSIAIIDITGVPTVDTLVAQHLLKTVAAARLMGADCIISGIRPQIAQTIVHLGVELGDVTTKASLADAFATALKRTGMAITRAGVGTAPHGAANLGSSGARGL